MAVALLLMTGIRLLLLVMMMMVLLQLGTLQGVTLLRVGRLLVVKIVTTAMWMPCGAPAVVDV